MSDKVYLGSALADLDIGEKPVRISRVNLLVDSQTMYTAGDDTGRTIEKSVPWASQSMANDILAALRGIDYQPFSGVGALIDPSAEIGDGITVGGIYSVLAQKNVSYGKVSTSSIAAPESDEIEDEYPYLSKKQREDNRRLAQTYSYITKTSNEIKLGVANDLKGMRSEIDIQLDSISLRVDNGLDGLRSEIVQTASSLEAKISDAAGNISRIEQYVDSISLSVSNGETSSTISLMAGSTEIDSENITFSGFVTFTGLSGGTTTIDGACIKTGEIGADRINLTGAITWQSLSSGVQDDINGAYDYAESAIDAANAIADGEYYGTFIDGTTIYSPTIRSNVLEVISTDRLGGNFNLVHNGGEPVLSIYYSAPNFQVEFWSPYGATFLFSQMTEFYGPVGFYGGVSGISVLSLSPEESKIQTLAAEGKTAMAEEEAKKTVDFKDEGGVLKIELPNAIWYLDETGWHK